MQAIYKHAYLYTRTYMYNCTINKYNVHVLYNTRIAAHISVYKTIVGVAPQLCSITHAINK